MTENVRDMTCQLCGREVTLSQNQGMHLCTWLQLLSRSPHQSEKMLEYYLSRPVRALKCVRHCAESLVPILGFPLTIHLEMESRIPWNEKLEFHSTATQLVHHNVLLLFKCQMVLMFWRCEINYMQSKASLAEQTLQIETFTVSLKSKEEGIM